MLQFHKDDIDNFEAAVTVGGTAGSERMARLILTFKNRKLMFDGVFKNNRVQVAIPKLMDVEDDHGVVTLEVIADRTYFEAYTSEFELTMKKSVEVDDVSVQRSEPITVVVEDINLEKGIEENIFTDECSTRNRETALRFISNWKSDEELDEDFTDSIRTWASEVFKDTSTKEAKVAMTVLARKLTN